MKKPVMIGAHVPKKKVTSRHRGLYSAAKEVNSAYDAWARKRGASRPCVFQASIQPTEITLP